MKFIYLDIDGVMNKKTYGLVFESRSISALNAIINITNGAIIITSSLRHIYSVDDLGRILRDNEIKGKFGGTLEIYEGLTAKTREAEIEDHIRAFRPDAFIIIDDQKLSGFLGEYQIHTEFGLQTHHIGPAVHLMMDQTPKEIALRLEIEDLRKLLCKKVTE